MQLKGIHPVLYAFWQENGALDPAAMAQQVDYCIASGVDGLVVLGLVTEVHKMDVNERAELVKLVGRLIAKRVPYGVTVAEPSVAGQIAFSHSAIDAGADWIILQPIGAKGTSEERLIDTITQVAEKISVPVAVQNNPVNLEVSLSVAGLVELNRRCPHISILKGEGWSIEIARVISESSGAYQVMGGHGGIEFPALLRSGGAGLIPAPDFLCAHVEMYRLWSEGTDSARREAEAIHSAILPSIVFMSRSVPGMLCYGKRLFARQAGIEIVADRAPSLSPTEFGLAEIERFERAIRCSVSKKHRNASGREMA